MVTQQDKYDRKDKQTKRRRKDTKRPKSNEKGSKLRKDGRDTKDNIDNGIGIYKIDKPIPCFLSAIMLPFIRMMNSKKRQL